MTLRPHSRRETEHSSSARRETEHSSSARRVGPRMGMALFALASAACGSAPPPPPAVVAPAPPPKDDGKSAEGGTANNHSAILEQLKTSSLKMRVDRQDSVNIPLPDGDHWTRVRFWGVKSLVGFRYGKDHHAVVGAFVSEVPDNTVQGACGKAFEAFAMPFAETFEVEVKREKPQAFAWRNHPDDVPQIIEVEAMLAKTATLAARDEYAGAYAVYPVWGNHCLAVGVAVPDRGDLGRAIAVRDRFVKEVLPKIEVLTAEAPKERY